MGELALVPLGALPLLEEGAHHRLGVGTCANGTWRVIRSAGPRAQLLGEISCSVDLSFLSPGERKTPLMGGS